MACKVPKVGKIQAKIHYVGGKDNQDMRHPNLIEPEPSLILVSKYLSTFGKSSQTVKEHVASWMLSEPAILCESVQNGSDSLLQQKGCLD